MAAQQLLHVLLGSSQFPDVGSNTSGGMNVPVKLLFVGESNM